MFQLFETPFLNSWFGEKDLQVAPKENIEGIQKAIKVDGNSELTTKIYPDLNHLFQHAKTGSPSEYATIEETFSEEVLKDMVEWMEKKWCLVVINIWPLKVSIKQKSAS